MQKVGVARRFFAFAVDETLFFVPISIATSAYLASLDDNQEVSTAVVVLSVIVVAILLSLYFSLMEAYTGRTIGKRMLNIRVVKIDGSTMDMRSALIRNAMRIIDISFNSGLVGAIAIWVTPNNQRLGDLAAKTIVVRDQPAEAVPAPAV